MERLYEAKRRIRVTGEAKRRIRVTDWEDIIVIQRDISDRDGKEWMDSGCLFLKIFFC